MQHYDFYQSPTGQDFNTLNYIYGKKKKQKIFFLD